MTIWQSEAVLVVQICADTLTAITLATIALAGRWVIFREAVALRKQMQEMSGTHAESMETVLAELAALKRQIEELDGGKP